MSNQFFNFDEVEELLKQAAEEYLNKSEDESKEIKLKNCPICNCQVRFNCAENFYDERIDNEIYCNNCDLIFRGSMHGMTKEEIAKEWNARKLIDRISSTLNYYSELANFFAKRYEKELDPYDKGFYEALDDIIGLIDEHIRDMNNE